MKKNKSIETITASAGIATDQQFGAVIPPLYLSSNFAFHEFGKEQPYDYTRSANPTRDILATALAELEGGYGGTITSSGMSAISLIASILDINASVILPHDCYGGTYRLFAALAEKGALRVKFVNQQDLVTLKSCIEELQPKLIWVETPSNPLLQTVDIEQIVLLAKTVNALVAVDNTFLSPALQNPIKLGADIVMHSTTKYINGHSDVVGGAVIANNKILHEKIQYWANNLGVAGAPFDAYLTTRGLRTLSLRMQSHETNAMALAQALLAHEQVSKVYYPGLESHPSHLLAAKQQKGFGGMLSFELKGGLVDVKKFFEAVQHFYLAESLGGFESLVCHPFTMTHAALTEAEKAEAGISEGLVRISAGLEAKEDLISGLNVGLNSL